MARYKGFDVDNSLYAVIQHMSDVDRYRGDLHQQQIVWDYLSVLGQLARLDNQLSLARKQFSQLTAVLLNRLGLELLKKTISFYGFRAQVAIDILLRNLFERTADIGFLATDDDIRQYLLQVQQNPSVTNSSLSEKLRERFQQYVDKYSVYHNIILLDTQGNVLLQLDPENPVRHSKDPLIAESLHTQEAYVENFRHSDLLPNANTSLIYSYRVVTPGQESNLGVVCLCFRFENEFEGIVNRLLADNSMAILCLLDQSGKVIASSDMQKVAINSRIAFHLDKDYSLLNYNDIQYFCCTRKSDGYQGYRGAGWLAHIMLPIDKAFRQSTAQAEISLAPDLLATIMQSSVFEDEIKSIPLQANQIQRELNRSVWNGNLQQSRDNNSSNAAVAKVLLGEIKSTGTHTKRIFEQSIADIQTTVISNALQDSASKAALAIDIMDRNLYERANDCRWWALDTTFRQLLNNPTIAAPDAHKIAETLGYINGLYTVYSNLLVFDKQGWVIAVSDTEQQHLVGTQLDSPWVGTIHHMRTAQHYAVSDFVTTPLYDNLASYIYVAAIRSMDDKQVLGGIAIVFDSAPQFMAMLQDVLPSNEHGNVLSECFSLYVDADKNVIASTHSEWAVGAKFEVEDSFYSLRDGQSGSKITSLEIAGTKRYFALGCSKSDGYREYKSASDVYQSDVFAFVGIYLGDARMPDKNQIMMQHETAANLQNGIPVVTFFIGQACLALRAEQVDAAVYLHHLVPIHGSPSSIVAGYMMYKNDTLMVIDTAMLLGLRSAISKTQNDVVVVKVHDKLIGLLVDELGEMLDISYQFIQPIEGTAVAANTLVREFVLTGNDLNNDPLLQLLDVDMLRKHLIGVVPEI